jgi:2-C-methyl-D-erythritol 4-phosphate cytidylyltransferase
MAGIDKLFVEIGGLPVLARTLQAFETCVHINHVTLVLALDAAERALALLKKMRFTKVDNTCVGGEHRQDSVRAGLRSMRASEWVVVHDGARPFVTPDLISQGIGAAQETGAATCGMPAADSLKQVGSDGTVLWTIPRDQVWTVQTPQVFRYDLLYRAHEEEGLPATDDAELVERLGERVAVYPGSRWNIKITTAEDLIIAEALIRSVGGYADAPDGPRAPRTNRVRRAQSKP